MIMIEKRENKDYNSTIKRLLNKCMNNNKN